ncbi:MAG: hypothetical protein AAB360_04245 [Patescibacteria group bacterium]
MRIISRIGLIIAIVFLVFGQNGFSLAETSSTSAETISLVTTEEISAADLESPKPKAWNFWRARLRFYITRDSEKRAALAEELTEMELLKLVETNKAKRAKAAARAYEKFTNNQAELERILAQTTDSSAGAKIEARMIKNKMLYAALMDKVAADGSILEDEVAAKRRELLKEAAAKLNELSEEEAKKKLEEVIRILETKEGRKERRYQMNLALLENLDQAESENEAEGAEINDDDILDKALKTRQDEITARLAKEDPETVKKMTANLDEKYKRHLLILEEIYAKAPEAAKPALQKVIDEQTEKLIERSADNKESIKKIFEGKKVNSETEKNVKMRIEEKAKEKSVKVDEALKEAAEAKEEREKKIKAIETEKAKKLEESAQEKIKKQAEEAKENAAKLRDEVKNRAKEVEPGD